MIMTRTINRLVMTAAFKLVRRWYRLMGTSAPGAGVAVWHHDQLLVVRHSYRPGWSLPGGRQKRGEDSQTTALRELKEEVGVELTPEILVLVFKGRSGHSLFECQLQTRPTLTIDNLEIIQAQFLAPAEIADPDQSLRRYLRSATRIDLRNLS